jgi:hypothetical protein
MTPEQFFEAALPYADRAHASTGVLVSVILSQWANENGYRWPPPGNNPGNVGNTEHGGMVNYATIDEGVAAYIHTMLLGYYSAVRAAKGPTAQARALGASPWAAGHYGSPPGTNLIAVINAYNLTRFDGAQPPPPPAPAPTMVDMIAPTPSGNGYWLIDQSGAVITRGDAQYFGGPNTSPANGTPSGGPPVLPAGQSIVSVGSHPTQQGYWCESSGGLVYGYGASKWFGNV